MQENHRIHSTQRLQIQAEAFQAVFIDTTASAQCSDSAENTGYSEVTQCHTSQHCSKHRAHSAFALELNFVHYYSETFYCWQNLCHLPWDPRMGLWPSVCQWRSERTLWSACILRVQALRSKETHILELPISTKVIFEGSSPQDRNSPTKPELACGSIPNKDFPEKGSSNGPRVKNAGCSSRTHIERFTITYNSTSRVSDGLHRCHPLPQEIFKITNK